MRWKPIPFLRARSSLAAAALVVLANLAATVPARAAGDLQGTITVAGVGSGNLLSCNACTFSFATTGYVTGLDGSLPFAVSWGTPGVGPMPTSMSLTVLASCQGALTPLVTAGPSFTFSISGAILVDNGVTQNATVTGTFNANPETTTTWLAGGLGLTVHTPTTTLPITIANSTGVLSVAPASDFLCDPQPTEPTTFAVSGMLLTAL